MKRVKKITSRGKVIAEISSLQSKKRILARRRLRASVLRFARPLDPIIDPTEWEVNR